MSDNLNIDDIGKGAMAIIVRVIGLFLLLAGLWVAIQVMLEALELYQKPQKIERFAVAIEQGSNIDKSLVSLRASVIQDTANEDEAAITSSEPQSKSYQSSSNVRVSYFLAWVIVILLLLLIARISLTAIKTGGELVLFDMQIKQFAKMLVKESSKRTGD
jgi:hypothetical protein